ncbi:MAG: metallophosphoesterase [Candidatus Thorarchaeota archaeon]
MDDRGLILQIEDTIYLVIADIHLGYEIDLANRTRSIFPYQHEKMLERVTNLVDKHNVDTICILGDVKHTITVDNYYNWEVVPEFFVGMTKVARVIVVPGNHDGNLVALLPRDVILSDVHGIVIGSPENPVGLLHGHAWPSNELLVSKMMVAGHNHPSVRRLRNVSSPDLGRADRYRSASVVPVVIKSKLDIDCIRKNMGMLEMDDEKSVLITLPSFNELISGMYINRPNASFIGPLFENQCTDLRSSEVFSLDGIFLGTVEDLQNQFIATK